MTANETERLTKVEANQNYMSRDITELKEDFKSFKNEWREEMLEIKTLISKQAEDSISKKVIKYFVGLGISMAALWVVVLNYIHNIK